MKWPKIFLLSLALVLSSCTIVEEFTEWPLYCPDFPSVEEVQTVLTDHKVLIDRIKRENLAIDFVIVECSDGAYLNIHYPGISTLDRLFEVLDEADARLKGNRTFFGVPFKFTNL